MIILLSPAKTFDFTTNVPSKLKSKPLFERDAKKLVDIVLPLGTNGIARLMSISENLATLNFERLQNFRGTKKIKQAVFAFNGDVYEGLNVKTFSEKDLIFSQKHLRILSGLYGFLRPMDNIKPYRLEMGTRLLTERGENLYDWWGGRVAKELEKDLLGHSDKYIINLASIEYFKVVKRFLTCRVITPIFEEKKKDKFKTIGIYAKKARGLMASFILKNRINSTEDLKSFSEGGYLFNPEESSADYFKFQRNLE
ncbi:MAG: hypothetical protein CBC42_07495 [Betaproteobacteria bacterium TMED82]|nr:MAG: hypothetical protein CBC42_07495 [Betaproteobacteria bacterium TMED82]|tara:strand:- start:16233 stop:16994 length:762 start_codon:yes stop_codon:yes gene_type:complete